MVRKKPQLSNAAELHRALELLPAQVRNQDDVRPFEQLITKIADLVLPPADHRAAVRPSDGPKNSTRHWLDLDASVRSRYAEIMAFLANFLAHPAHQSGQSGETDSPVNADYVGSDDIEPGRIERALDLTRSRLLSLGIYGQPVSVIGKLTQQSMSGMVQRSDDLDDR